MKRFFNQKGAALILVIASILFLTMISLDMFDDSLVGHQMAVNYRSRVQAYYLAKSAINFSKMLLYYNKKVESTLAKKKTSLAALGYEPLYKMIPLSSETLRAMVMMNGGSGAADEGAETEGELTEDAEDTTTSSVGMLQKEGFEDFLSFDGNFLSEINEEQSKYSVNAISKMTPTSSSFDLHKKVLLSLLLQPEFRFYFENQDYDAVKLVHAIADFVDSNEVINEFDQVERGSELSSYENDVSYKVKNGPLMTLSELRLVAGMSDDIYETLKPMLTVYHTSEKVNVCLADEKIVDALIVHYTVYAECTTPLDAEKDADDLAKLRDAVLAACPDKSAMASALNVELGLATASTTTSTTTTSSSSSSKIAGCKIQFEDLLSEDNDIFRIQATGSVKDVETTINVVLDTSNSKASKWKILYYQID